MSVYTVHVHAGAAAGDPRAAEEAVLVRDGFAFFAFLFTFLWFFAHRLWLAGIAILIGLTLFGLALDQLALSAPAAVAAHVLVSILIGLEANSLYRWTLARRGLPAVDVVTGATLEEAERKAVQRWLAGRRAVEPGETPPLRPAERGIIGLFPEPEAERAR